MNIIKFKNDFCFLAQEFFPGRKITILEKRSIILEIRLEISEFIFIEIYYNSLTDKKSYAIIKDNKRIASFDNYKYWHMHPCDDPDKHIACKEPSMREVFSYMNNIFDTLNNEEDGK
jgi:hypothetical protein